MAKPPVNRESDKFMLRLPDGMRDLIAEAAKDNGRSMSAEIVHRLERSFPVTGTGSVAIGPATIQATATVTDESDTVTATATVRQTVQEVLDQLTAKGLLRPPSG
jgi:uncharacterized protein YggE